MEVARTVFVSVVKASPPRTVLDVIRHMHATMNAVKLTTLDPKAFLTAVASELPEDIQMHVNAILVHDELFQQLWDQLAPEPKGCFQCFMA